eukprot:CAMPEP_0113689374 /NCGR_PEP_ID=MMETSP0038_2-20120614/17120_1 /TAXON_ID=2898 /ORGANISM="Cryptomonas paramecium" /LENGTH=77 /DNA_ID=CAMNT_0000610421 /DNA_START=185 /DNA_END=418 /DNA_ORIENTATION=- /assembly_acc=CAM_ASM_000170
MSQPEPEVRFGNIIGFIASSKTVSSRVQRVSEEVGRAGGLVLNELIKSRTISQRESGDRLRFEGPSSKSMDDSTNIA